MRALSGASERRSGPAMVRGSGTCWDRRCTLAARMHPIGVTGRPRPPPSKIPVRRRTPVGGPVRSGAVNRTVVPSRLPRWVTRPRRARGRGCRHADSRRQLPRHARRSVRHRAIRVHGRAAARGRAADRLAVPRDPPRHLVRATGPSVRGGDGDRCHRLGIRDRGPGRVPDHRRRPDGRDHRHHARRCARASRRPASRRPSARSTSPRPGSSSPAAGASTSSSSGRSGSWSSRWSRRRTSRATSGRRWELRDDRGRWVPIEAPVDRASRDAERVRGWLGGEDRDFVVRVYAAIVTDDNEHRADARPAPSCRPASWRRGSRRCRSSAASTPSAANGSPRPSRRPPPTPDPGSTRPLRREGGRGARTRTWNRRDISPLL